jgi:hypothetical protein
MIDDLVPLAYILWQFTQKSFEDFALKLNKKELSALCGLWQLPQ